MFKINRNYFIMFIKYFYFIKIGCYIIINNYKKREIIFCFFLFDDFGMRFFRRLYLNYIKSLKRIVF